MIRKSGGEGGGRGHVIIKELVNIGIVEKATRHSAHVDTLHGVSFTTTEQLLPTRYVASQLTTESLLIMLLPYNTTLELTPALLIADIGYSPWLRVRREVSRSKDGG